MNTDIFKGNLNQFKGAIQKKWGNITDQDFDKIKGQKDKLVGLIQEKYGEGKESIEDALNNIMKQYGSTAQDAINTILQTKDEAIDYTRHLSESLQDEIKRNPLTSVLTGLAIGFIIGKLSK